jgi:peptidoglycan-associated lipoprotein
VNHIQRKLTFVLATLLFLALISGCGNKKTPPPPPPPPPAKPVTATLSANPASIQSGQSSTLTWSAENADQVTLNGKAVDPNGSQSVSPTQTTSYHLAATGKGGNQSADATVTVTQPPPPPPPPPPSVTDEQLFAQSVVDIYFDYDKYDLRSDAQQALNQAAQAISQHPNWKVRIEGNCDERGSTEYNLSLGSNRAQAAKDALAKAGVGPDQLTTISYGKEKPVCNDATEDCWQKNRHDHFTLLQH